MSKIKRFMFANDTLKVIKNTTLAKTDHNIEKPESYLLFCANPIDFF